MIFILFGRGAVYVTRQDLLEENRLSYLCCCCRFCCDQAVMIINVDNARTREFRTGFLRPGHLPREMSVRSSFSLFRRWQKVFVCFCFFTTYTAVVRVPFLSKRKIFYGILAMLSVHSGKQYTVVHLLFSVFHLVSIPDVSDLCLRYDFNNKLLDASQSI